jgi:phosphohistidine phosphatase
LALKLFLLRHGEAESKSPTDAQRELTPAGRAKIAEVAVKMGAAGLLPEKIFVSPAKRCQQTFEILNSKLPNLNAVTVKGLYEWDANGIIYHLASGTSAAPNVMIIAHNPSLSDVVDVLARSRVHMTPGQLVVLTNEHLGAWYDLESDVWAVGESF